MVVTPYPLTRPLLANVVTTKKITSHSVLKRKNQKLKVVPDCSLVSGLQMFETYDREPLSAHEQCPMRCASITRKKMQKVDDCKFVGYVPAKKAFRIYNKRTWKIIETIHVTFDELSAMASEQFSLRPGLHSITPATSSSGLVTNPIPQQPCIPPPRDDWDLLFQPIYEESPKTPLFHDDPLLESTHEDSTSHRLSSNMRPIHTPFEHLGRWTKDHPIANVIGDPSRSVTTRKQLKTDAM
ncbi:hypothetical protein Tco_0303619 [Tanacetum coccineum]